MDSSVSPKEEFWFLCVCHHISTGLYYLPNPTAHMYYFPNVTALEYYFSNSIAHAHYHTPHSLVLPTIATCLYQFAVSLLAVTSRLNPYLLHG